MEASEVEQKLLRAVPVHVRVERGINLRGSRGDVMVSLVRAEYGAAMLGESARVPSTSDSSAEYDFSTTFDCPSDGATGLDDVAHKPVLLMVIEVLPKEKKQKEDKTVVLGQATVDLLPLVQGQTKYSATVKVYPVAGSSLENVSSEADLPSLEVSVSAPEPLLSAERLAESNLLRITVESAYGVPATWASVGPMCNYTASLPVPISAEKEHVNVFANGALRPAAEKEASARPKRWPLAQVPVGGLPCIPGAIMRPSAYEEEDGELAHKEDWDFRMEAENEKTRVTWDMERRCYMDPGAVATFQKKIAESRFWPVEVAKIQIPMAAKGGRSKSEKVDEDSQIGFHGVAYVNLAPLLYPGATVVRGAYRVHPYSDVEMLEKTKRTGFVVREAARLVCSIGRGTGPGSIASPHPKPAPSRLGKETIKKSSTVKHVVDNESESSIIQNAESQQYLEAQTYIVLEFCLEKPLVPKRKPEELAKRVADLIPPRPPMPRRIASAQQAVSDYHDQVAKVASMVLDEFRAMFPEWSGVEGPQDDPEGQEKRKRRLLYELNSSGKYFAFKEQLKQAVVNIVREKYLKTTAFEDRDELQAFLGELYIFLIDQMHVSLNKVMSTDSALFVPEPLTDSVELRNYAREAELNGDSALATKYYQERLARDKNNPDHWFDYGTFCLRSGDSIKAEECFHDAVALDQRHLDSLAMCGVMCNKNEGYDEAETFFENATCVHASSSLAWTMLGLFYEGQGNDIRADKAFLEAQRQSSASVMMVRMGGRGETPHVQESSRLPADDETALLEGTSVNVPQEEPQGPMEPLRGPSSATSHLTRTPSLDPSNAKLSGVGGAADEEATAAATAAGGTNAGRDDFNDDKANGGASATDGNTPVNAADGSVGMPPGRESSATHAAPTTSGSEQALAEVAVVREIGAGAPKPTASASTPAPASTSSIFMEAACFLLDAGAIQLAERALALELVSAGGRESGRYCTALARLFMLRGEVKEAEVALRDAVRLDHQDPDGWAQLGHVCLLTGRVDEAKDHYQRTLSFTSDASDTRAVLMRLASIYTRDTQFEEAKEAYLRACKLSPSCLSWLGVAISCYRLGELTEAEDALAEANFLNNSNAEVWAYLALVCLQTGRQLEAEQSYKYAVKGRGEPLSGTASLSEAPTTRTLAWRRAEEGRWARQA
ncbi:cilia- and flagella-associated protein 70 isoform X1 [Lethenteron reissneri]|uniref:cilia- and flagella-associated protein 70 isoform X1 n=1 Tax=Lethenteron reissneri TaxID=7753 RepID=UPI002AB7E2B3|nr:cilia- and flagella-associated protein 70 isoform X1 [Lethenteron reissneri]XP_061436998.1 cilia- and flagella-associated protein 70 isoform X1 [Lethenteron reissneri]